MLRLTREDFPGFTSCGVTVSVLTNNIVDYIACTCIFFSSLNFVFILSKTIFEFLINVKLSWVYYIYTTAFLLPPWIGAKLWSLAYGIRLTLVAGCTLFFFFFGRRIANCTQVLVCNYQRFLSIPTIPIIWDYSVI